MSDLIYSSVPATDPDLRVTADCSEFVASNSSDSGNNAVTEEMDSTDTLNTSGCTEPTSQTDVSHDANAARGSSCNDDNTVVNESIILAGSTAKKTCDESVHVTEAADGLVSSDSKVTSEVDPVSGLLRSAEQCRSDTVTFNLPLEVIGACWFMKRDTQTYLQATTSNDGLFSNSTTYCC